MYGYAEEIVTIGSTCNGAIPGFGSIAYLVCQDVVTQEKKSSICCSESKISKGTIPVNESLARILQADLINSLARVLSRRQELASKKLNIFMMGDSTCVACLFSPTITIKNVLLRTVFVTVKQRIREIIEMLPETTV